MAGGIFDKLRFSYIRKQVARGLWRCPECDCRATRAPETGASAVRCEVCGTVSPLENWEQTSEAGRFVGRPDEPPLDTKIVREDDGSGTVSWHLPRGEISQSLVVGILACLTCIPLGGFLTFFVWNERDHVPDGVLWGLIVILGIIWTALLGTLRLGLRRRLERQTLRGDRNEIRFISEFIGNRSEKTLPLGEVMQLRLKSNARQGARTTYEVEIRGRRKKWRAGHGLTVEEVTWLVADLRRTLLKEDYPAARPPAPPPPITRGMRQSAFSLPLPEATKGLMSTGIAFTLAGMFFLGCGLFFIRYPGFSSSVGEPLVVRIFDGFFTIIFWVAFRVIWNLIALVVTAVGVWAIYRYFRARGRELRLEGNETEVAIRALKHGRVVKERAFPRHSVMNLRTSHSGSIGAMGRSRVSLIAGEQAVILAAWVDSEVAEDFVKQARVALGVGG